MSWIFGKRLPSDIVLERREEPVFKLGNEVNNEPAIRHRKDSRSRMVNLFILRTDWSI
jgi:hypothetical protein